MNCRNVFSIPIRLISNSSCLHAKAPTHMYPKTILKLADEIKVPVETDAEKLATYVCGTNLLSEGGEDIKIKPDSEYPEWLWKINPPLPLEELSKDTKTYWNRIRRHRNKELKRVRALDKTSTVHK